MFSLQASDLSNHGKQEEEELTVFGEFAKVCPLPLLLNTAQNRPTPEPDILCDIESGEKLAFELGQCEDVTKDDANPDKYVAGMPKKLKDKMELEKALRQAYREALAAGRIDRPERFKFHSVTVYFEDRMSCTNRKRVVHRVIKLLNQHGPGRHPIKNGVVRSIHCERDPANLQTEGPPTFHVPSGCGARPSVVERIEEKLTKKYGSNHKIHLLAWSTTACQAESVVWKDRLVNLLQSNGMGQFERIWVFGWHEKSIVFDSAASSAG
jgi:hypothetical protein